MERAGVVRDAAKRELIGLDVRVAGSGDATLVGLVGRVVDETRNTLRIERPEGREVTVAKRGQTFAFAFPEGVATLPGDALTFTPEDRIKRTK